MKLKIILLSLLTCSAFAFSQKNGGKGYFDAKYECTYSIKYIIDTIKMTNGREDWFILKIGDDCTYGYSYLDFYRDSLFRSSDHGRTVIKSFMEGVENGTITSSSDWNSSYLGGEKLYKDYKKKKLNVLNIISNYWFIYEDELAPQNWIVLEDTITIAGYACQKAICDYRGRSYEAWFTPEIPISEGPWKFYGLPGLIMKLYDTKHHYDFELIELKKVDDKIDIRVLSTKKMNRWRSPKVTEIGSRKEFLRMQFGERGAIISRLELYNIGLSPGENKTNYGYIELDY